jgi:hypothetical protein
MTTPRVCSLSGGAADEAVFGRGQVIFGQVGLQGERGLCLVQVIECGI